MRQQPRYCLPKYTAVQVISQPSRACVPNTAQSQTTKSPKLSIYKHSETKRARLATHSPSPLILSKHSTSTDLTFCQPASLSANQIIAPKTPCIFLHHQLHSKQSLLALSSYYLVVSYPPPAAPPQPRKASLQMTNSPTQTSTRSHITPNINETSDTFNTITHLLHTLHPTQLTHSTLIA